LTRIDTTFPAIGAVIVEAVMLAIQTSINSSNCSKIVYKHPETSLLIIIYIYTGTSPYRAVACDSLETPSWLLFYTGTLAILFNSPLSLGLVEMLGAKNYVGSLFSQ